MLNKILFALVVALAATQVPSSANDIEKVLNKAAGSVAKKQLLKQAGGLFNKSTPAATPASSTDKAAATPAASTPAASAPAAGSSASTSAAPITPVAGAVTTTAKPSLKDKLTDRAIKEGTKYGSKYANKYLQQGEKQLTKLVK